MTTQTDLQFGTVTITQVSNAWDGYDTELISKAKPQLQDVDQPFVYGRNMFVRGIANAPDLSRQVVLKGQVRRTWSDMLALLNSIEAINNSAAYRSTATWSQPGESAQTQTDSTMDMQIEEFWKNAEGYWFMQFRITFTQVGMI